MNQILYGARLDLLTYSTSFYFYLTLCLNASIYANNTTKSARCSWILLCSDTSSVNLSLSYASYDFCP